jgi:far upstream element-binding protein
VFRQAEAGGSGIVSRRVTGQSGSDTFVMKVPNNKVCRGFLFVSLFYCYSLGWSVMSVLFQVGLVIGKGGETIKNMQARTGARIQVFFIIYLLSLLILF